MNRQIRHLLEITDTPHVTIRLLPFDIGAHPGQPGGFTIITLPQEAVADVVYVESPAGQLFLEGEDDLIRRRRVWRVLYERALGEKETQEALHRMASAGGAG